MPLTILKTVLQHSLFSTLVISHWKKSVINANRKYIYQKESETELENFKKKLYRNLSNDAIDFLTGNKAFKTIPEDIDRYPVQYNGLEFNISEKSAGTLKEMKKGGLMLTAHLGNYEAMGPWLCRLGIPLKASYSKIKPASLNRFLESKLRSAEKYSYSTFIKSPKEILTLIDEGYLFCFLADQDYRKSSAVPTHFLGKPINCNPIPSFVLRHRPKTPVYICWMDQKENEYILCAETITVKNSSDAMDQFNIWLEKKVKENGAKWYGWLHRRFKGAMGAHKNIYSH